MPNCLRNRVRGHERSVARTGHNKSAEAERHGPECTNKREVKQRESYFAKLISAVMASSLLPFTSTIDAFAAECSFAKNGNL